MTRFRLWVEYDGRPFMGWQRQPHGPSVQQAIEEAAHAITGETITVHAAGRTDAGVHAFAMSAHLDIARPITAHRLADGLNAKLRPLPVAILKAEAVADDWHARFSCLGRRYVYRIANRRAPLALDAGRAWRVPVTLHADAMNKAAQLLVGRHDFTTFRSAIASRKPGQDARSARRQTARPGHRDRSGGALLPPPPGALDGRLSAAGRARPLVRRRPAPGASGPRPRALGLNAPPDGLYFVEALYPDDPPMPNSR
jgi:tRNA pseudouridine38-40 synthase